MAETWIRVHAQLVDKPVAHRAATALGVPLMAAIGHLVCFWGGLSDAARDGRISDVPDSLLERWAGWTAKRGRFAAFVREHHMDGDGRVNEWDEYQGALETRREKARDKKRRQRETARGQSEGQERDVPGTVPEPVPGDVRTRTRERNGTERNGTEQTATTPPPAATLPLRERLASEPDRLALDALLRMVPSPAAWSAEITASLDGMAGHAHITAIQAGQAIRDYVAAAPTSFGLKHFRSFLLRATIPGYRPATGEESTAERTAREIDERNAREAANA